MEAIRTYLSGPITLPEVVILAALAFISATMTFKGDISRRVAIAVYVLVILALLMMIWFGISEYDRTLRYGAV